MSKLRKVTDITIRRAYEVECPHFDCDRVIDVTGTYSAAVMARRQHWFEVHNDGLAVLDAHGGERDG